MINGAHVVLYSDRAEEDRAFLRDAVGLRHVDAGGGWLIFALPPSEVAIHPSMGDGDGSGARGDPRAELYLMCEDIERTRAELTERGVTCSDVRDEGWGLLIALTLPGGGEVGVYQPRHPTALDLRSDSAERS